MFTFKQFTITDEHTAMKVGTDAVLLGCVGEPGAPELIVDAGCGSGLLALMMAQRVPGARIAGIEIDPGAAADARANVAASPWSGRIEIIEGDVRYYSPTLCGTGPLTIISNPPFFNEPLRSDSPNRSLARHGEGWDVTGLIEWAAPLICRAPENSQLIFIAPAARDAEIDFALTLNSLVSVRTTHILPRPGREPLRTIRHAILMSRLRRPTVTDSITLREPDGSLTPEYRTLTSDFYLDRQ